MDAQQLFSEWTPGEARNRTYDVLHYRIVVEFDEPKKKVNGIVSITLVPFLARLDSLDFDAEGLDVHRVTIGAGTALRYAVLPRVLRIWVDKAYTYRDTITISTAYSSVPRKGLYFVQPDSAYADKPWQIWTQGEAEENHYWFPCYDFPNDRATSEIIATVQNEYTVLSNGRLLGVTEDKETKTYHWKQEKPHASYLITLVAGAYEVLEDRYKDIPVFTYVYPHQVQDAKRIFRETADMIRFFSETIGYEYPWEKYAQVTIADFMWGGMENTSATTLNDESAIFDERAELDRSSRGLIAHELAHQWWGDLITCKDWRHLWLNEGFATYFEGVHEEYRLGKDQSAYSTLEDQRAVIISDKTVGRKPIVSVNSYGANLYPRGAAVLHMLRFVLSEELFWRAIQHYARRYEFRCVETNDFRLAIEESTGQNLSWFFDQWVYKAGYPEFEVSYRWDESARSVLLSVKQVQEMDSLTGVFRMPADVEITTASGARLHRLQIAKQQEEFAIPVDSKPTLVVFDKGNWILKEVRFPKSREELVYQLRSSKDVVERLTALEQLRSSSESMSDEALFQLFRDVARADSFWALRMEAVNTIVRMSMPGVENVLIEACEDEKSNVRQAAVNHLGRFHSDRVREVLRKTMDEDLSYVVNAEALKAYAKVDSASAYDVAVSHLETPSYDNDICRAALSVLGSLADRRAIPHLIEYSAYGKPKKTREVALTGLRRFVREEKAVQDWTISLVNDRMKEVRLAAIRMLDSIGGDGVIKALLDCKAREIDEEVLRAIDTELRQLKSLEVHETH